MAEEYYYCTVCEEDVYGRAEVILHKEGMDSVHEIIIRETLIA